MANVERRQGCKPLPAAPCSLSSFRVKLTGGGRHVYDLVQAETEDQAIILAGERNPGLVVEWIRHDSKIELDLDQRESSPDSNTLRWKLRSLKNEHIDTQSCSHFQKKESPQESDSAQS